MLSFINDLAEERELKNNHDSFAENVTYFENKHRSDEFDVFQLCIKMFSFFQVSRLMIHAVRCLIGVAIKREKIQFATQLNAMCYCQ